MNYPRKLRMALIGGAGAGFIGKVHATAAQLDQQAELVAGAFSSDPDKSRAAASAFGVDPQRTYRSFQELVDLESKRADDKRIDFVSIATPNHTHFEMAKAALLAGWHVVCEKPMTIQVNEAEELAQLVQRSNAVLVVMHNYTGYPMVRQAKQMISDGEIGTVLAVRANYIQGWLCGMQSGVVPPRGAWKADPSKAGPAGALGDIGTHAFNLVRYVTGLQPQDVTCRLATLAVGRQLDDYGHALIRFTSGVMGMVTFSQMTHGRLNDLCLEIDGTKGSLVWRQEEPNQLFVRAFGQPTRTYDRHPAAAYMNQSGKAACRLPAGHPEAFFEAFANVFRAGFADMHARLAAGAGSQAVDLRTTIYPNVYDGLDGTCFVEKCLASHRRDGIPQPLLLPDRVPLG